MWPIASNYGVIDLHLNDSDCVTLATLADGLATVYDHLTNLTFTIYRNHYGKLVASSSTPLAADVLLSAL